MTVKELKKFLSNFEDEDSIVIKIERPGNIGPTSTMPISSVQNGFDWDSGKVIIWPLKKLRIND